MEALGTPVLLGSSSAELLAELVGQGREPSTNAQLEFNMYDVPHSWDWDNMPIPEQALPSLVGPMGATGTHHQNAKSMDEESHGYDDEALLAATQAMAIYMLLQASDSESMRPSDVVSTTRKLVRMVIKLHLSSRTLALLFMIELLFEVFLGDASCTNEGNFKDVPVPSSRDLWDPDMKENWASRLQRYLAGRNPGRVLTMGDVRAASCGVDSSQQRIGKDPALVRDVARWCENVDPFGTLMWMAVSLDRWGRV
ncbi:hypothetical protein DL771_006661 [Monosporascus sp. 5C6A]|nr:hypothetical protein DL771_006661 [Monosporascus sp. 5C6A]